MIAAFWCLLILVMLVLLYLAYRRMKQNRDHFSQKQSSPLDPSPSDRSSPVQAATMREASGSFHNSVDFSDLRSRIQALAKQAWTTKRAFKHPNFLLRVEDLSRLNAPAQVVEVLLRHAQQVVPGFAVPTLTPRVLVTTIPFAAGQFEVDEDGWVTIKLGSEFFQDKLAAQAILAHEVCHYILENTGIRSKDYLLNERDTDLCMFVCGFGSLFLAGYRREAAQHDYRPGHQLGYLSDAEYQVAQQAVLELRSSTIIAPPNELEAIESRLSNLLYGDQAAVERYVEAERRRNPQHLDLQLYQDAIARLERDRH